YNPWSVGRLWCGVWATLNGLEIPDRLPDDAQNVLGALTWDGPVRRVAPQPHWINALRDTPRNGPVHDDVRDAVNILAERRKPWV
ncbi:MAG: acetoin utilization protein AcuC, partial [Pseudomonadota bacterium]